MKSINKKIIASLIISSIFIGNVNAFDGQIKNDNTTQQKILKSESINSIVYNNNDPFEYIFNLYKVKNKIREDKRLMKPLIDKMETYNKLIRNSKTQEEKAKYKKEMNKIEFKAYSLEKIIDENIKLYQNGYLSNFKNFINKYYQGHLDEWNNFIKGLKTKKIIETKDKITSKEYWEALHEISKKESLLNTMLGKRLGYGNKDYNFGKFNNDITKDKINKYLVDLRKNSIDFQRTFKKTNEKDPNGKVYYENLKIKNLKRRTKQKINYNNSYKYNKNNNQNKKVDNDIKNKKIKVENNNIKTNIKKENKKISWKEHTKQQDIKHIISKLKYIDTYRYNSNNWRTNLYFSDKDIGNIYLYLININDKNNNIKIESAKKEIYDKLFKEKIYLKEDITPSDIHKLFVKLNGYNSVNVKEVAKMYYTPNKISPDTKRKLKKLLDELLLINKTLKEKLAIEYKEQLVPKYFSEEEYKKITYAKLRDEHHKLNDKIKENADKFRFETNNEERNKIFKEKKYLDSQINIISSLSFLYIRDGAINRNVKEIKEYNSIYNKYMSLLNKKALYSIKKMDDEKIIKILSITTGRRSNFNYANLVKEKIIYDVFNDFLLNNTKIGKEIKNIIKNS